MMICNFSLNYPPKSTLKGGLFPELESVLSIFSEFAFNLKDLPNLITLFVGFYFSLNT